MVHPRVAAVIAAFEVAGGLMADAAHTPARNPGLVPSIDFKVQTSRPTQQNLHTRQINMVSVLPIVEYSSVLLAQFGQNITLSPHLLVRPQF